MLFLIFCGSRAYLDFIYIYLFEGIANIVNCISPVVAATTFYAAVATVRCATMRRA